MLYRITRHTALTSAHRPRLIESTHTTTILTRREIADHLTRLTHNQRNWGFGVCFLYLRDVKGYRWNHKRVYRIYRELELNLRIKPRKRIVREKPEPLAVPETINHCWSMDFMPSGGFKCAQLQISDDLRADTVNSG